MKPSTAWVAEVSPDTVNAYKQMRSAILVGHEADRRLYEMVVVAQLALLGHEVPFKLHALALVKVDVTKAQLRGLVMAGLGVTLVIPQVSQALRWIEEILPEPVNS